MVPSFPFDTTAVPLQDRAAFEETPMFRAALLAASLLVSLPCFTQGALAQKTTLNVGIAAQDSGRLDPHFAVSTIDRIPVAWMFNALVRFPPGTMDPAKIEGDLAERWETSADKKTWTF